MRIQWKSAFTALEALIVLAFFGLVMTFGALSIQGARARMRDAVRLSDMQVLRASLHVYWQEKASYPVAQGISLGEAGASESLTLDGFVAAQGSGQPSILERVPQGPKSGERYYYVGGPNGYAIRFETERETFLGPANVYYVHGSGFDTSADLR